MDKVGNWVRIDKGLTAALPLNRPYTIIEAVFSLAVDVNNKDVKGLNEYARMWRWSRSKVTHLIRQGSVTTTDRPKTTQRPVKIRLIEEFYESKYRANTEQIPSKDRAGTTTNNNNNNNNNKKSGQNHSGKFIKPTIIEIDAYCKKRNNDIDAEEFFHFYESCNWKIGNKAMRSWESTIITWEKRKGSFKKTEKGESNYRPKITFFCPYCFTEHDRDDVKFRDCLIKKEKERKEKEIKNNSMKHEEGPPAAVY